MINVTDNELEAIGKFLNTLSLSVIKVLSKNLDISTFESFEFQLNSTSLIGDMKALKGNNVVYEVDYLKGEETSNFAALIPEELIAIITNSMLGSSGGEYSGNLSEAQLNSCSELLPKILSDIEGVYRRTYNQNLVFDEDPLFLNKANASDYERKFERMIYNLIVDYTLCINSDNNYKVSFLFKYSDFKSILGKLRFVSENAPRKVLDAVHFEHLANINIDITAELGRSKVPIKYALELDRGSMVQLDSLNGEDVKVFANGVEVARAQIVVVEENFGLRITKIVSREERLSYVKV